MDNPDKVAGTQDTRQRQAKQNNRTQYVLGTAIVKTMKNKPKQNTKGVGHHYTQSNTNNINKTTRNFEIWTILYVNFLVGIRVVHFDQLRLFTF